MKPSEYKDYFKQAAENHLQLEHTETNKSFYFLSYDEILKNLKPAVKFPCLFLENPDGEYDDNFSDNIRDNKRGAFMILNHIGARSTVDEKMELVDQCWEIGTDIISKMWNDRKKRTISGFTPGSVRYQMVGPILDNCYGYRWEFSFDQPAEIKFDATKWNNESQNT